MTTLPSTVLAQSFLSGLPDDLVLRVLTGSKVAQIPAGRVVPRSDSNTVALVLDGMIRLFLQSPVTGRQVTVRYARPGEALGLVHLFGSTTRTRAQCVSPAQLCILDGDLLKQLCGAHPALAMAMARECAARTVDAIDELALVSFGSVRQRVARHLLDLAARQADSNELLAVVTQQALADACGSVREVVARVLKDLHSERLTAETPTGIAILDVAALDAVTHVT